MPVNQKPPDKFSRYTDPTGQLSNRDLKTGEWYVEHKIMLRNILIGFLGVWCAISVGYGVLGWLYYFVSGYFDDRALARREVAQFQNYAAIQQSYKALPLAFSAIQVYAPTDGHYDFVTLATNNNERVTIRLTYQFTFDGGQTETREVVILPKTTVPVASLGNASDTYPGNPALKTEKIVYERISAHEISRIQDFVSQRTKFTVDNLQFVPPQEGVSAARVKFDITNQTVFEFWEPFFYAEVMSGATPVGIFSFTVSDLKPEEKRSLDISTFIDVSGADDIRITPVMDIFDQSIYKKP